MRNVMMRKLDLDFVRQTRPLKTLGVVLFLFAVSGMALVTHAYLQRKGELDTLQLQMQKLTQLTRKVSETGLTEKKATKQVQLELTLAQRVIGHLAMPWEPLFQTLESTLGEDVSLLSVIPDTEKMTLSVTAEAKNLAAMISYQQRLAGDPLFQDVYIASHQTQQQDLQKPVRFMVNARWVDPALHDAAQAEQVVP
ncbi:PilN domain-containing protein [Janthinobacterium sp. SUN118]|uniref:PilN domain-containing protein n=1 Tax=Janthinobacterium sp. SUN118 TaxID=3004100 RepID=UPI0025AF111C|nr:PilN domain-containing protein [Janthinobacterium sp. SUN118]MDN2709873.1 PilN domain-containing protein [Janthinobacterium sp. SUN118]